MAYEFQKLSEVEALTEVPEGANALIEVNGDIKRVPGSGLGGATGIKTAIIKDSNYDDAVAGRLNPATPSEAVGLPTTYECLNMTFEEAYETMRNGEPLSVFGMLTVYNSPVNSYGMLMFDGIAITGSPLIVLGFTFGDNTISLFWTTNGISTEQPGGVPK